MKRKCPYCHSIVPYWSVIKPGLWGNDLIKCINCKKELSRLWTSESLSILAIFAVIQIGIVVVVEKFFTFEFFIGIALYIFLLVLVLFIATIVIYYFVPLKGDG